ncbi:MAG: RidA family protein [Geminicoccaceae bacterium]
MCAGYARNPTHADPDLKLTSSLLGVSAPLTASAGPLEVRVPSHQSIVPDALSILHSERGHSPGVRVGDLLLVSGMLGRESDLTVVHDHEAQIAKIFDNMRLVLAEAGCNWGDIVELTAYFIDLRRDFDLFMKVRNRYLQEPWPAMTMVGIAELAQPGLICEVKGMAAIPRGR